ncbi:MAG: hypothetical protein KatS3mg062_0129 [Tepidiforma sp.]|nr:MAG: hypothetical protein KatS3mg062_0129 [Tepidiforma sp.]
MSAERRAWLTIGAAAAACVPGIAFRLMGYHPPAVAGAATFGLAILAAAFLLSWGAETAEMDISQGLALAIIAIIAVLPEYAVDFILAWKAGADPAEAERGLAVANMTGGNRLLIGVGWPLVFFLFFYRTRIRELVVDRERSLELTFLAIATLYVIFIPLRSHVSVLDTIVLVSLFLMYMFFTSRVETEEVELVGPARAIGALQAAPRRAIVIVLLVYSAAAIFASAEPFAESLVHIGEQFGVSEFFLIQWLAPLASESPEVLVACLLAWRGRAAAGMGVLISSKVNQWTLLIGTLPIAFLVSAGEFGWTVGLPLDARQRDEIFLTAAQSAFAIAVFANLRMSRWEAAALFSLFATQLFITNEHARVLYGAAYAVLCVVLLAWNWRSVPATLRDAVTVMRGREIAGHDAEEEPGGLVAIEPASRD